MGKSFGSYGFLNSEMRSPSTIAKVDPQGMPVRIFHKSIVSPSLKCICIYICVYNSQIVSNSAWQMNLWYIAPAAAFETLQSEEFKSSAGTWRCSSPFPTVLRCPKPSFWCKWTIIISNNSPSSSSQINCSHKKKTLSQGLFTPSCWILSPFKWGWFNFVGLLTGPPWPHSSQGRCAAEHLFYPGAALTFASHATSFQGTNEAHWITVLGSSPFKGATWVPQRWIACVLDAKSHMTYLEMAKLGGFRNCSCWQTLDTQDVVRTVNTDFQPMSRMNAPWTLCSSNRIDGTHGCEMLWICTVPGLYIHIEWQIRRTKNIVKQKNLHLSLSSTDSNKNWQDLVDRIRAYQPPRPHQAT